MIFISFCKVFARVTLLALKCFVVFLNAFGFKASINNVQDKGRLDINSILNKYKKLQQKEISVDVCIFLKFFSCFFKVEKSLKKTLKDC